MHVNDNISPSVPTAPDFSDLLLWTNWKGVGKHYTVFRKKTCDRIFDDKLK